MNRLMLALAVFCAIGSGSAMSAGWNYDGAELAQFAADYEALRDSGGSTDDPSLAARVAYYTGFVAGVVRANSDRGWFCLSDEVNMGQTWDAVAKFLREHPDLWDRKPSTIVTGAAAKTFPCAARTKPAATPPPKPKTKRKPTADAKPAP